MKRRFAFPGKLALVTGAASGIGEATSLELALRGARLTLVDKDPEGLERVAKAARALGASVTARLADLGSAEAIEGLAREVLGEEGVVDVLVNNAGVAAIAPFLSTAQADWDWMSAVNLWGPLRLTRALLPAMVERKAGHVVIVASLGGLVGAPGMVAYSTTKFAMVGFAEALRLELAETGVGVTTVCPGYVRTNLHRATRYGNDGFRRFLDDAPSFYGLSKERVATEVADAVEARRALLVLGPEKVGWWLKRLAPELAFQVLRWTARRTGLRGDAALAPKTS